MASLRGTFGSLPGRHHPRSAKAWFREGNSLAGVGRYGEPVRCYDRALVIDPRFTYVRYSKALSEEGLGRQAEAASSYQQFVELPALQDGEERGTGCALGVLLGLAFWSVVLLLWVIVRSHG